MAQTHKISDTPRYGTSYDPDPAFEFLHAQPTTGIHDDKNFRAGFARLAPLNLSYDALVFHPQLDDLTGLVGAFPDTTIIVNHLGGLIGIGHYREIRNQAIAAWKSSLKKLAQYPNVYMKLGGVGMFLGGSPLLDRKPAASLEEVAADWRPFIEFGIEQFGVHRCMFESNFPVDSATCSYTRLWNAFKLIAKGYSAEEKKLLFGGVANAVYNLHLM